MMMRVGVGVGAPAEIEGDRVRLGTPLGGLVVMAAVVATELETPKRKRGAGTGGIGGGTPRGGEIGGDAARALPRVARQVKAEVEAEAEATKEVGTERTGIVIVFAITGIPETEIGAADVLDDRAAVIAIEIEGGGAVAGVGIGIIRLGAGIGTRIIESMRDGAGGAKGGGQFSLHRRRRLLHSKQQ